MPQCPAVSYLGHSEIEGGGVLISFPPVNGHHVVVMGDTKVTTRGHMTDTHWLTPAHKSTCPPGGQRSRSNSNHLYI